MKNVEILVKSVQIRSFFWSLFSCIQTEYGDLRGKFKYSVRKQEKTDQKKLRIWTLFTKPLQESSCSHLNFIFRTCFKQEVPGHSSNYRVWIHSETRT